MSWDHRPWEMQSRQRDEMEWERREFKRLEIAEELRLEKKLNRFETFSGKSHISYDFNPQGKISSAGDESLDQGLKAETWSVRQISLELSK